MRYMILALFLMLGTMPVQASACDMHGDADTAQGQHAGMDHGEDVMDCCDDDVDFSSCDSPTGCSTNFNGNGDAIHQTFSLASPLSNSWMSSNDGRLPPATDAPPFRPPIS